jgi:hypothetical protein
MLIEKRGDLFEGLQVFDHLLANVWALHFYRHWLVFT